MKLYPFKFLFPIIVLILSCTNNQSQKEFERLEVWEEIRIAAKEKKIDYLLKISNDTLDCIECNFGKSWITKEDFFNNYFEQIEVSGTKKYTVSFEEIIGEKDFIKRYQIIYSYGGNGKGEEHSSIYTILAGEKGIQFQGVIGVP